MKASEEVALRLHVSGEGEGVGHKGGGVEVLQLAGHGLLQAGQTPLNHRVLRHGPETLRSTIRFIHLIL